MCDAMCEEHERRKKMLCKKCGGLLIFTWFYGENERCSGLQCVNCSRVEWINHRPAKLFHRQTLSGKYDRPKA